MLIVGCAVLAILGYLRASHLNTKELNKSEKSKEGGKNDDEDDEEEKDAKRSLFKSRERSETSLGEKV